MGGSAVLRRRAKGSGGVSHLDLKSETNSGLDKVHKEFAVYEGVGEVGFDSEFETVAFWLWFGPFYFFQT